MVKDEYLDLARTALVRLLHGNQTLKHDRAYHVDYVEGYVKALEHAEDGDPAEIVIDPTRSDAYKRGYNDALADIGINDD